MKYVITTIDENIVETTNPKDANQFIQAFLQKDIFRHEVCVDSITENAIFMTCYNTEDII